MPATAHKSALQTTTVRLPKRLYEAARCALAKGETEASSFNDLLVESLEEKLEQLRRQLIDAEFAEMKNDAQYHREASIMAQQFTSNDRDTLRSAEKEKS
jgi:hypothetical protein